MQAKVYMAMAMALGLFAGTTYAECPPTGCPTTYSINTGVLVTAKTMNGGNAKAFGEVSGHMSVPLGGPNGAMVNWHGMAKDQAPGAAGVDLVGGGIIQTILPPVVNQMQLPH